MTKAVSLLVNESRLIFVISTRKKRRRIINTILCFFLQVITMSQTPFISNDAIPIDTPVSTLELLETSGKEIEIRDLPEPVSIFLSLNQSEKSDLNNITGVTDSKKDITFFKIESGGDHSFYFTLNCSGKMNAGQELVLVLMRNSKPTSDNFDLRWKLASCNSTLRKLISKEYLHNSEGLYLGVKLAEASNLTNGTSMRNEIHYAVSVKAIGCYYWNERMQAWRADGCKVNVVCDRTSLNEFSEQL